MLASTLRSSRDGRLLLLAHAAMAFVSGSLFFAVPWTALERGASVRTATWLGALHFAGYFCLAGPAGRRADTGSRRSLLRWSAWLRVLPVGTCALWSLGGAVPLAVLALTVLVVGAAGALLLAASYPAVDALVLPSGVRGAHAQLNVLDQLSAFGFGAVGAAALAVVDFGQLLWIQVGVSAVALLATYAITESLGGDSRADGAVPPGDRTVRTWSRGPVRTLLILGAAWNVGAAAFAAVQVPWLHERLGFSAGEAALVLAAGAAGAFASGVVLSRRSAAPTVRLLLAALCAHALFVAMAVTVPSQHLLYAGAVLALAMLANAATQSLLTTARAEVSTPRDRGAVLSTGRMAQRAGYFASSLAVGALVPVLGFVSLFLFSATASAVAATAVALRPPLPPHVEDATAR